MKPLFRKRSWGLTLIEVTLVVAAVGILVALLLPSMMRAKIRALRISCVSDLKMTGLAYRIWESDHGNLYPMAVSETNGGSMEFITGTNAFRHFQVMSNEFSGESQLLLCPADKDSLRFPVKNFANFNNSNISYFVGVEACETNPQMILSGDRNIINGTAVKNGVLELTTNQSTAWTAEIHNYVGNLCLADGSVQQVSTRGLGEAVENTGYATNRLQMPVLGP